MDRRTRPPKPVTREALLPAGPVQLPLQPMFPRFFVYRPFFRALRAAAGVVAAGLLVCGATPALALDVSVSFSSVKEGDIPKTTNQREFTCSDTVYVIIRTRGLADGIHAIQVEWFDPLGDRQELTQFEASTTGEESMIWAWLRLHAPEGLGIARNFDPSHGMRNFIGRWRVKIEIDHRHRATDWFDMLC